MKAGHLDTPATLMELGTDLQPCQLDWLWCEIQTKESGDVAYPTGLRNPAKVAIRAWWDARLRQGRYLATAERLFHIDSVRDFTGKRVELAITATEFVGECAAAIHEGQPPRPCRVFLLHDAPYRDEFGQATSYRTRAEVALIEAGRPQADSSQIEVGGVLYNVIDYADQSDDGIVRGLWLAPVA
ncbi:hypothetical protein [Pseudomonas sp. EA_35y_Pfl2_R111]|uniref:hypothetical protein n=1 Tax=Pseudomonas sp. EA_35y_Pfl2_R111 TaxID=3088689 RepID=UPI0030DB8E72